MDSLCEKLIKLLDKPEEYLRPSDKLQTWVEQTRNVYNFIKDEEGMHSLPASADSLHHLNTDGLDTEQIWQLLELQNKSLLAAPDDLDGLDDINLCFSVAKLSSLAKYNKLLNSEEAEKSKDLIGDNDSLLSKSSDGEEDRMEEGSDDDDDDDDEDEGMGSLENLEEEDSSDDEMFKKPSDIDGGLNLVFDDDSDNEEDNFDELLAPEGMEDSDEEDDNDGKVQTPKDRIKTSEDEEEKEEEIESEKGKNKQKSKKFGKTEVDSKFFHLRECEWVADNDMIGDNFDLDSEDIDLMEDITDGEEDEDGVMYDAFFDGAKDERKSKKLAKPIKYDASDDDDDSVEEEEEDDEDVEQDIERAKTLLKEGEPEGEVTQLLGLKKKEEKSTFEKERERELTLMSTLEEDNITEKPWYLRGEAVSTDRPENSTLEEQLEYNVVARQRPVITEDTTTLMEKIILNRIRSKAWDDVIRKVKPNITPFEFKKKLLLDQDKSKKSLAEIYEQEYMKQQQQTNDGKEEEELPEHKEIREKMDGLFTMLDALANYHYTPKQAKAEVKIQSNLPAVTMEEATPDTATDATLLAPQEILAPVRGELRGKSELTSTDKKRERRAKKVHQKKKSQIQEKKLQEKLKKTGGGKRLDIKTTVKFVEKAVKSGQVKMLEGQQNKVVRSSQSFFKQLQDNKTSSSKNKNPGMSKKRKSEGQKSASKLLL